MVLAGAPTLSAFNVSAEEWRLRVQVTSAYVFLGVCGIILNILPIALTICRKELRNNKVNILVANLSTAEILFCTVMITGQPLYILYREQLNPLGCQWLGFINFICCFLVFAFPPLLALNRYISLYHSRYYERIYTVHNIALMIGGCYVVGFIPCLVYTLYGITGFDDDNMHCCVVVKDKKIGWTIMYWIIVMIPKFGLCDGTMMFCNYKIYKKLKEHASANALKNNVVEQNREILYFLMVDLLLPIGFHGTYQLAKFAHVDRTGLISKSIFVCLYFVNSCLRGLITLTMLRPYRVAMMDVFRCSCFTGAAKSKIHPSSAISGTGTGTTSNGTKPNASSIHNHGRDYQVPNTMP